MKKLILSGFLCGLMGFSTGCLDTAAEVVAGAAVDSVLDPDSYVFEMGDPFTFVNASSVSVTVIPAELEFEGFDRLERRKLKEPGDETTYFYDPAAKDGKFSFDYGPKRLVESVHISGSEVIFRDR